MKKCIMSIVVFVCGAMVMILELIAARILSPYVGSSNAIWTSIIGVILISMSLGYSLGGKLADKKPDQKVLSILILASAIFVSLIPLFETIFIKVLASVSTNLSLVAIVSALFTFAIPSALLATVSPYAIKLMENGTENLGRLSGKLSALSTLGSITGTFLAGFYLIPAFGNRMLLLMCTIVLILMSLILYMEKSLKYIEFMVICIIAIVFNVYLGQAAFIIDNPNIIEDTDSEYSRIWVVDYNGLKVLQVDTAVESYTDNSKMGAKYLEYYDLFDAYNKNAKDTLIIGGAAYTYPTHFLAKYEDKNIDVVEIDEKMTELAIKHFNLDATNERLNIYHQDGRSYINNANKKYDTIFIDAFKGYNVPFELTTAEALTNMKELLNDNGMVIANVISAVEGEESGFLNAQYATFKEVFPEVRLFAVRGVNGDLTVRQNLILIGFKNVGLVPNGYEEYLTNEVKNFDSNYVPFTDDYAPVEKYIR